MIKLENTHTTTLSAKDCTYQNGVFYCNGEPIDFASFLDSFDSPFDLTIKKQKKDVLNGE